MMPITKEVCETLEPTGVLDGTTLVLADMKLSKETVYLSECGVRLGSEVEIHPKLGRTSIPDSFIETLSKNIHIQDCKTGFLPSSSQESLIVIDENGRYVTQVSNGNIGIPDLAFIHTSSGKYPLKKLQKQDYPIVCSYDCILKTIPDNQFGCANDFLHYYRKIRGIDLQGLHVHVMGTGPVGMQIAQMCQITGALSVSVSDKDISKIWMLTRGSSIKPLPVKDIMKKKQAVIVLATGSNPFSCSSFAFDSELIKLASQSQITLELVIMGSGHEVDLATLYNNSIEVYDLNSGRSRTKEEVLEGRLGPSYLTVFKLSQHSTIILVGDGQGAINNTCGHTGHSASALDLVWAQYLLSIAFFVWEPKRYRNGIQPVPTPVIHSIQKLDLEMLGFPFEHDVKFEQRNGIEFVTKFEELRSKRRKQPHD